MAEVEVTIKDNILKVRTTGSTTRWHVLESELKLVNIFVGIHRHKVVEHDIENDLHFSEYTRFWRGILSQVKEKGERVNISLNSVECLVYCVDMFTKYLPKEEFNLYRIDDKGCMYISYDVIFTMLESRWEFR